MLHQKQNLKKQLKSMLQLFRYYQRLIAKRNTTQHAVNIIGVKYQTIHE